MVVEVQDLTMLNQADVDLVESRLVQLLKELDPTVDLSTGVVRRLVVHLKAVLDTAAEKNIRTLEQSGSLKAIIQNPDIADEATVDRVLSNYRIVRSPGARATGSITVVIDQFVPTVIPEGSIFSINNIRFVATASYGVRTDPSLVTTPQDVLLVPVGVNQWGFTIPLTASDVGAAGNVPFGSTVVPAETIPNFVKAYAATDFTGGRDPETNQQLLDKLKTGLAVRAWTNRISAQAMITNQPAFAGVGAFSIIGFGDAEMLRDAHSIWPGHLGGRSDLYCRTAPLYQTMAVTLPASLVAKAGPLGTWQIGIGRDDIPAYYLIDKVLLPDQNLTDPGFPLISEIRTIDLTGYTDFQVDITDLIEGVYTRYQAAVVQFQDTVTDVSALPLATTRDYVVVARVMPLIAPMQDFVNGRDVRPPMGDVLVKAPIPCFCTASFTLNVATGNVVDTDKVRNDVATAVNALGFTGQLASSFIDQTLHQTVHGLVTVSAMSLAGTIRRPDGTSVVLGPSSVSLVVPNSPAFMTTGRTVVFFLKPEDITVTVVYV